MAHSGWLQLIASSPRQRMAAGKVVDQVIGAVPKAKLKEKLDALAV